MVLFAKLLSAIEESEHGKIYTFPYADIVTIGHRGIWTAHFLRILERIGLLLSAIEESEPDIAASWEVVERMLLSAIEESERDST